MVCGLLINWCRFCYGCNCQLMLILMFCVTSELLLHAISCWLQLLLPASSRCSGCLKDRYGEPKRGGEWMGADKNSSRRRWRIQHDEHGFQHTSLTHYPSWPRPRSHWSATDPRNQLPNSQTRERSRTQTSNLTDLHRSDRWAPPVRPIPAGET
jgi:hypothetical protein